MEESPDVPMDTDVSSTTEDVLDVPSVLEPHCDMETSVSVEPIKEEALSPCKTRDKSQDEKAGNTEASKSKVVQIKKIVIKANNKTYHIQKPVVISASKMEAKNVTKVDSSLTSSPQSKEIVDSSSRAETVQSPEKSSLKGPEETEISVENSSSKETAAQVSNTDKYEESSQNGPINENTKQTENTKKLSPTKIQPALIVNVASSNELEVSEVIPKEDLPEKPENSAPANITTTKPMTGKEQTQKQTLKDPTKAIIIVRKDNELPMASPLIPTSTKTVDEKTLDKNDDSAASTCSSKTPLQEDKEASNDSQMETNSEASEKDHSKSISRELKSLLKSAKESKIISECTQLTSKTRKSRTLVDASTSLNALDAADKVQGVRRASDNSQASNCSEKSERTPKRSMRSQNPEFVSKVKNFMSLVSGKLEATDDETETKIKEVNTEFAASTPKKKKENEVDSEPATKSRSDTYCWRCHWPVEPSSNEKLPAPLQCTVCPRSFHYKCLSVQERSKILTNKSWVCPECLLILQAENSDTRSLAMKKVSLGMLCELLKHALERMKDINGVEPFLQPVDRTAFPDYDTYVVHPMDLSLMEAHINEGYYGSTEAFLTDAHWILHNSIIFNTLQSKLTGGARALVRSCRAEMGEIEACPECYAAAHARRPTWFTDVCSTPHLLLWAKLKGFPYWPAKAMTVNSSGLVDVRFFGQHDRAWVPARDCFLYSESDPNSFRTKRQDLVDSMQEAKQHIHNINLKYGSFVYQPFRTTFDPAKLNKQLKMMIPNFEGEVRSQIKEKPTYSPSTPKGKSRSNSKSSKESHHDGETSETEDVPEAPTPKTADSAETVPAKGDQTDKDEIVEVDDTSNKEKETRKRRHSQLKEAVVTILDSTKDKKKRVETSDVITILDSTKDKKKRVETSDVVTILDSTKDKKKRVETSEKTAETPSATDTAPSVKTAVEKEQTVEASTKKEAEPSPSTSDKDKKSGNKQATIRVISIAKILNTAIKTKDTPKQKADKTPTDKRTTQEEKTKTRRSRNSKCNKSLNSSNKSLNSSNKSLNSSITIKDDKQSESVSKDTPKDAKTTVVKKTDHDKIPANDEKKTAKEQLTFDDDVSLAELAKKTANDNKLPTISNVRSISSTASTETTQAKTTVTAKLGEVTVVTPSESSVFTSSVTESVKSMKEAVDKLQKLRNETEPSIVGRVGVRAFARMTSPPKETAPTNDVLVEIKAEPIDFDDADRQMEKMDLMNAITLKPVNPLSNSLREVRINKVVAGPASRKPASKPVEIRPKAKKTFPQPKKPEEGRSELTSKNSMVYIPIQPPMTQAPIRMQRQTNGPVSTPPQVSRPNSTISTTSANTAVNTVTTPLVGVSMTALSSPTVTPSNTVAVPTVGNAVHTVPLITSVNGQWTFSLQPMMSVGGIDNTKSPPMVNGERALQVAGTGVAGAAPVILGGSSVLAPIAATPTRQTGDNPPREPPRLQQRPGPSHPLDPAVPPGPVPPPSSAGPLTAKLNQNAVKLADYFRTLLEESLEKLDDPRAQLVTARVQLEQARWRHQQEVEEIKHNHELTVAEMRASFEKEKTRVVTETRRAAQTELETAIKLAKSKQWCAKCSHEAQFYCCWNTSYCDYPCQRAHWAQHYSVCAQQRAQDNSDGSGSSIENRLQAAPDHLPKTTAAPNLTVGGKLAPSRVYTQEIAPKNSIIMSMVEEGGTQTMKCVGTYKPSGSGTMAPLIINKQILTNEDAAKKVVTSGGYLIVGAANAPSAATSSASVVTPVRRVQYFS